MHNRERRDERVMSAAGLGERLLAEVGEEGLDEVSLPKFKRASALNFRSALFYRYVTALLIPT